MSLVPRTWRRCNNDEIESLYLEICGEAIDEGLIDSVPTLYLFKSTAKWGQCRWSGGMTAIGLNEVFCTDPEKAINTIIHEIGHAATPGHHHDSHWKKVSDQLGKTYGHTVKRCTSEEEKGVSLNRPAPQYKYVIECPKCHYQWKRQKMSKIISHATSYTCPDCKVNLIRVK